MRSKSSEEPNRYEISGTYYIACFCFVESWGRFLTDWQVKGSSNKFVKMVKGSLRYIFDIKLSIYNFSLGFLEICSHNECRWFIFFFLRTVAVSVFHLNIPFVFLSLSTWWTFWNAVTWLFFWSCGWNSHAEGHEAGFSRKLSGERDASMVLGWTYVLFS